MDMVCEKTPSSNHDFTKDPIIAQRQGDWLIADGTTLGADNGIAIAMAMALVDDSDIRHPPLELLFTVDEESGLNGAKGLDPGMVHGRIMINLDSEDEGVFTVGCAGGHDLELMWRPEITAIPDHWVALRLDLGGLKGGHSGIDIHRNRGNANKLLARALDELRRTKAFRLVSIDGGSRHNAIPRDAAAVIVLDSQDETALQREFSKVAQKLRETEMAAEPGVTLTLTPGEALDSIVALTAADTERLIDLLLALPHGVISVSRAFAGEIQTSCNLATVRLVEGKVCILSSQRSSTRAGLEAVTRQVLAVAGLVGAENRSTTAYPPWMPDAASPLLSRAQRVYRRLFGKDPVVQVIHAGLECAIIGDVAPGMDMISLGPTIENPHSPSERLNLPSVDKVWSFLVALLEDMH